MSSAAIVGLGAIAGFTIFLGLPIGRVRSPVLGLRAFLNALAIGVLVFLLWDVLVHAMEPLEGALTAASVDYTNSWAHFAAFAAVFAGCIGVGLLSLSYYDSWMQHRRHLAKEVAPTSPARRLAFLIAIGIGLHNFSEGLAIGQSAAAGAVNFALLLVIGFGLHNATEGFGIVAPLAAENERPGWGLLLVLGLIGGGPTFVGTLIGQFFVNDLLYMAFLALAAGSILYVVIQLLGVATKFGRKQLLMWGVLLGLLAGFGTDLILTAAGA